MIAINFKKNIYPVLVVVVVVVVLFVVNNLVKVRRVQGLNNSADSMQVTDNNQTLSKLNIYYFHRTQRCATCRSIGRYTGQVVVERFNEELKNGLVEFKEVNVELPENKALAEKFKASGPSLVFDVIRNGSEEIDRDLTIWQLVGNEVKFKNYLEVKIRSILPKV